LEAEKMSVSEFLTRNATPIDTVSKVAQILALLLAGFWTYKTFYESERPGLELRVNAVNSAGWSALPGDRNTCEATLNAMVENTGKRAVDVTSVKIVGWLSDRVALKGKSPTLVTRADLTKGEKFFDESFSKESNPSSLLIGHFPPGASRTDSFVWYFNNQQNKVAFWELTYGTSKPTQFGSNTYFWDYVCRGLPEPEGKQAQ
jgi:hypothetical protein